jgi:hypothetical protein
MLIFYTGIGCKKSEIHTEKEFLNIMNKEFTNKNWTDEFMLIPRKIHYQLKFKDWCLPEEFTFFTLKYTDKKVRYLKNKKGLILIQTFTN